MIKKPEDPLGFTDGPNLYAYVKNQPLILIDPYGLSATENAKAGATGFGQGVHNMVSDHNATWNRNINSAFNFQFPIFKLPHGMIYHIKNISNVTWE